MKRKRVYNQFQINLIVFYAVSLLMVPLFIVIAYLFDLHLLTSTNNIVLIASIMALTFFVIGLTVILLRRKKTERKLKPSYYKEYIILLIFSTFGVVGFGIFYTYLGGSFRYVLHVIIPSFIVIYGIDIILGNQFFNVDLNRN